MLCCALYIARRHTNPNEENKNRTCAPKSFIAFADSLYGSFVSRSIAFLMRYDFSQTDNVIEPRRVQHLQAMNFPMQFNEMIPENMGHVWNNSILMLIATFLLVCLLVIVVVVVV